MRRGDGRWTALVPALLGRVRRPRRQLRAPRGGVRLRRDRVDARHDDARLAPARSRPRLSAVSPWQGDRAVQQRPGLPAAARRRAPGSSGRATDPGRSTCPHPDQTRLPRLVLEQSRFRPAAHRRPSLPRELPTSRFELGRRGAPAQPDPPAAVAQGHPRPHRRTHGHRARHRRHRRLQPRRPPTRRRGRLARRAPAELQRP